MVSSICLSLIAKLLENSLAEPMEAPFMSWLGLASRLDILSSFSGLNVVFALSIWSSCLYKSEIFYSSSFCSCSCFSFFSSTSLSFSTRSSNLSSSFFFYCVNLCCLVLRFGLLIEDAEPFGADFVRSG